MSDKSNIEMIDISDGETICTDSENSSDESMNTCMKNLLMMKILQKVKVIFQMNRQKKNIFLHIKGKIFL